MPTNIVRLGKHVVAALLEELANKEKALADAQFKLKIAQQEYEQAESLYVAIRNTLTSHFMKSPYAQDVPWPQSAERILPQWKRGAFQYVDLNPGEAVLFALMESDEPMTLDEIKEALEQGGLIFDDLRKLNAALMRTTGIKKLDDGRYAPEVQIILERRPMTTAVLLDTPLPNRTHRGKVRDTYDLGDGRLLIVATDRISAFDVVLPNGIPDKGALLTQMAAFWFDLTKEVVPNHLIRVADGTAADNLPFTLPPELRGRSTIVKKAQRIDVECIARGYITGSAWAEYKETGRVCGVRMPAGMVESEQFPEPIFTPTTKADVGHDENMSADELVALVGAETANAIRLRTLALYSYAAEYARQRGIIIADTKFEFGIVDGEPIVIDEMLTPDSSRFWPADQYGTGRSQPSFDKQFVRDWLNASGWNHEPPPPELPDDIVTKTSERYHEAYRRLTGRELQRYS